MVRRIDEEEGETDRKEVNNDAPPELIIDTEKKSLYAKINPFDKVFMMAKKKLDTIPEKEHPKKPTGTTAGSCLWKLLWVAFSVFFCTSLVLLALFYSGALNNAFFNKKVQPTPGSLDDLDGKVIFVKGQLTEIGDVLEKLTESSGINCHQYDILDNVIIWKKKLTKRHIARSVRKGITPKEGSRIPCTVEPLLEMEKDFLLQIFPKAKFIFFNEDKTQNPCENLGHSCIAFDATDLAYNLDDGVSKILHFLNRPSEGGPNTGGKSDKNTDANVLPRHLQKESKAAEHEVASEEDDDEDSVEVLVNDPVTFHEMDKLLTDPKYFQEQLLEMMKNPSELKDTAEFLMEHSNSIIKGLIGYVEHLIKPESSSKEETSQNTIPGQSEERHPVSILPLNGASIQLNDGLFPKIAQKLMSDLSDNPVFSKMVHKALSDMSKIPLFSKLTNNFLSDFSNNPEGEHASFSNMAHALLADMPDIPPISKIAQKILPDLTNSFLLSGKPQHVLSDLQNNPLFSSFVENVLPDLSDNPLFANLPDFMRDMVSSLSNLPTGMGDDSPIRVIKTVRLNFDHPTDSSDTVNGDPDPNEGNGSPPAEIPELLQGPPISKTISFRLGNSPDSAEDSGSHVTKTLRFHFGDLPDVSKIQSPPDEGNPSEIPGMFPLSDLFRNTDAPNIFSAFTSAMPVLSGLPSLFKAFAPDRLQPGQDAGAAQAVLSGLPSLFEAFAPDRLQPSQDAGAAQAVLSGLPSLLEAFAPDRLQPGQFAGADGESSPQVFDPISQDDSRSAEQPLIESVQKSPELIQQTLEPTQKVAESFQQPLESIQKPDESFQQPSESIQKPADSA